MKERFNHPLESGLFLVVAAVIAGADRPAGIEAFGKEKQNWLDRFVDLPAGIPLHDTIGRLLALIKPSQFQQALLQWIQSLREGQREAVRLSSRSMGKRAVDRTRRR